MRSCEACDRQSNTRLRKIESGQWICVRCARTLGYDPRTLDVGTLFSLIIILAACLAFPVVLIVLEDLRQHSVLWGLAELGGLIALLIIDNLHKGYEHLCDYCIHGWPRSWDGTRHCSQCTIAEQKLKEEERAREEENKRARQEAARREREAYFERIRTKEGLMAMTPEEFEHFVPTCSSIWDGTLRSRN